MYADIKLEVRDPRKGDYDDADTVLSWSAKRYNHLLKVISELRSVFLIRHNDPGQLIINMSLGCFASMRLTTRIQTITIMNQAKTRSPRSSSKNVGGLSLLY